MTVYTQDFYNFIEDFGTTSAQEVVPTLLRMLQPNSIADVGCGTGAWLSVFQEHGVEDFVGIDGDYVEERMLKIPSDRFLPCDLTMPLNLEREFDLAMSLEVAEHLPQQQAEAFVSSLTALSKVVLFSAAIPHQPGTHHINCQWLDYWAKLFFEQGYVLVDCLRLQFWQNPKVQWWYAQNMLLFVQKQHLDRYPELNQYPHYEHSVPPALVHPGLFLSQQTSLEYWHQQSSSPTRMAKLFAKAIYHRLTSARA